MNKKKCEAGHYFVNWDLIESLEHCRLLIAVIISCNRVLQRKDRNLSGY